MDAAGVDAFIGNASEYLAAANLASLPTMVILAGLGALPGLPASPRRQVTSAGIFARPDGDSTVRPGCFCRHLLQKIPYHERFPDR